MTSDPSMNRRVTRLGNDTESIYELITEVRSTQVEHTRRFDRIENALTEARSTQDEHTGRLDRVEGAFERRFDGIESTLTEVVRRLPEPS